MEITNYSFDFDKWYISNDEPYIFGVLKSGLYLNSKRFFVFFDNKEDFLSELGILGIEYNTNGFSEEI